MSRDYEAEIKAEFQRIHDDARKQVRTLSNETREYCEAINAATAEELKRRMADLETKAADYADRVAAALNRRGADFGEPGRKVDTAETKAFATFLRRGREAVEASEHKGVLHVSTDPMGGFLAPSQFVAEVLRTQREANPIRRLSRSLSTDRGSIEFPRQVGNTVARWVGELEPRQGTDLSFGAGEIVLHELDTFVDVTLRLLEDAAVSVESLIATDLGEAFAAAEGSAFLVGDQIKKPLGILHAATTGLKVVPTGSATDLTPDSLIAAVYAVGAQNSRNGTWLMSTDTARIVRQMKDGNGRYLWADAGAGLVPGQPASLLGRPVEITDDAPAVAAGSFPILFGDFGRACWVLNRNDLGLSIQRDEITVRGTGSVRFWARQRVGFGCVRPEALAKIKVAVA